MCSKAFSEAGPSDDTSCLVHIKQQIVRACRQVHHGWAGPSRYPHNQDTTVIVLELGEKTQI